MFIKSQYFLVVYDVSGEMIHKNCKIDHKM